MLARVVHLVSAGGTAMRRTVAEYVHAFGPECDQHMLAPDAEAKVLRQVGIPIESWRPAGLFNVLRSIGALRRSVERHEPEVLLAYGWTAAAVGLGALAPRYARRMVVRLQDPIRSGEMPKAFMEKRLPDLLSRAGAISCAYAALATTVIETYGVPAERVSVDPYPIAPGPGVPYDRMEGRSGPIVGLVQRLEADRAWETAIDALALLKEMLPEARLWLAGDGPVVPLVRSYARSKGVLDEITFFGDMPAAELLPGVDLVVVPQSRDALPYAMLEALVLGVPVIAANVPGLADALAPYDTAWLVPDDGAGFAHGIATVWPEIDAAWLGAQAQRATAAARYDPDEVFTAMFALCERVATAEVPDASAEVPPLPDSSDRAG